MGLGSWLGINTDNDNFDNVVNVAPDQNILNQQQSFANALQQQMSGQGPSLAANMLQNQAKQNAASAMGMAAAQRGVNPGLAMREAMQAGNAANQNAANQAATARVQEQLGAQGQLGGMLNTMQGQNLQSKLGNAQLNTQINQGNSSNNAGLVGGAMGALGSLGGMALGFSHGGMIPRLPHFDLGGAVLPLQLQPIDTSGAQALQKGIGAMGAGLGKGLHNMAIKNNASNFVNAGNAAMDRSMGGFQAPDMGAQFQGAAPSLMGGAPAGGPGLGVGGGKSLADAVAMNFKAGGKVPGKAKTKGDSYSNDTVPAMLSPGEAVIPRSVMNSPDAAQRAKEFVEHMMKGKKGGKK